MALVNTDGNYLKINYAELLYNENVVVPGITIIYSIYSNTDSRINGLGEFEKLNQNQMNYTNFIFNTDKPTFNENLLTGAYLTLKQTDFSNWADD